MDVCYNLDILGLYKLFDIYLRYNIYSYSLIPSIDVHTRRVGGAYGIKMSRSIHGAVASAFVAKELNRPCRNIQSLTTNTRALGKRLPCYSDFEVN